MLRQLYNWQDSLMHVFFPHTCSGCGSDRLDRNGQLCLQCLSGLSYTGFESWPDNPVLQKFTGRLPVKAATSLLYFSRHSITQHLLHRLKYRDDRALGHQLGLLMGRALSAASHFGDVDMLVPLPLHKSRERNRGYNQSLLLCKGIQEAWSVEIDDKCVIRPDATHTQTRKDRLERWENMEGRFIASRDHCEGKHLLLTDDVVTTGATLEACGAALLQAGARSVSIATLCYAAERL